MAKFTLDTEALTDLISALFTKRNDNWEALTTHVAAVSTASSKVNIGEGSAAAGTQATAVGTAAAAAGNYAVAVGASADSDGESAVTIGMTAAAAGARAVAVGRDSAAAGAGGTALGRDTVASGTGGVAVGHSAEAADTGGTALGYLAVTSGNYGGQIGRGTNATANSIQIGAAATYGTTVHVPGTFTAGTKTFEIPHPAKKDTHVLRHGCYEGPVSGGTIYRFTVTAKKGAAVIDLPDYFNHLNKDVDIFCQAEKHFGRAYGEMNGEQIKITADTDGVYKILVLGTRCDDAVQDWDIRGVERLQGENWKGEPDGIVEEIEQPDGTVLTKVYRSTTEAPTEKKAADLEQVLVMKKEEVIRISAEEAARKTDKELLKVRS